MTDPAQPRDNDADTTPLASGSQVPPPATDGSQVPPPAADSSQVYPAATPVSTSRWSRLRAQRVSLGVVLAALVAGGVLGAGAVAVAGHRDGGSHGFADQQDRNGGPGGSGLPGYGGRNDGGQFGGPGMSGPGMSGPGMNRRGDGNGLPGQGFSGGQGNQGTVPAPSISPSPSSLASSST